MLARFRLKAFFHCLSLQGTIGGAGGKMKVLTGWSRRGGKCEVFLIRLTERSLGISFVLEIVLQLYGEVHPSVIGQ